MLTVGSLFSGIGGLELGLERAGMTVRWQVERDTYAQRVLARHWPDVVRHDDVCTAGAHNLQPVDLICGGFPCQDISVAGKGAGLDGERSGLWREFARIVGEIRPRFVVVENVPALLGRGLGTVLGDLAALGFDADWDCLPASAVGAPHRRDRLWLVAYAHGHGLQGLDGDRVAAGHAGRGRGEPAALDLVPVLRGELPLHGPHDARVRMPVPFGGRVVERPLHGAGAWADPPRVYRVAARVPHRVDRVRCLGNAVCPQVAEWVGRRIVEAHTA